MIAAHDAQHLNMCNFRQHNISGKTEPDMRENSRGKLRGKFCCEKEMFDYGIMGVRDKPAFVDDVGVVPCLPIKHL